MFFLIVLTHHSFIEYEDKTWPFGPTNTEQLNAVGLTFTFAGGQRRLYLYQNRKHIDIKTRKNIIGINIYDKPLLTKVVDLLYTIFTYIKVTNIKNEVVNIMYEHIVQYICQIICGIGYHVIYISWNSRKSLSSWKPSSPGKSCISSKSVFPALTWIVDIS